MLSLWVYDPEPKTPTKPNTTSFIERLGAAVYDAITHGPRNYATQSYRKEARFG